MGRRASGELAGLSSDPYSQRTLWTDLRYPIDVALYVVYLSRGLISCSLGNRSALSCGSRTKRETYESVRDPDREVTHARDPRLLLPPTSDAVLSPVAASSAMTESTAFNRSRWLALRVRDILHGVFLLDDASTTNGVGSLSAWRYCRCCCLGRFFDSSRSFLLASSRHAESLAREKRSCSSPDQTTAADGCTAKGAEHL